MKFFTEVFLFMLILSMNVKAGDLEEKIHFGTISEIHTSSSARIYFEEIESAFWLTEYKDKQKLDKLKKGDKIAYKYEVKKTGVLNHKYITYIGLNVVCDLK